MPYFRHSLKSSIEKYSFRNQISKPFFAGFRLAKLKPFSSKATRASRHVRLFFRKPPQKYQKRAGFSFQNPRTRPAPRDYLIICPGCFVRSRLRLRRKRKCQTAPQSPHSLPLVPLQTRATALLGPFNTPHARPSLSKFWLKSRKLHKGP